MNGTGWVTLLVVTAPAVVTKVGSGTLAARFRGLGRHDCRTVGVLMSTRSLTELIALNAGLQAVLLSAPLYTVLVFVALATTLFTQPLLLLVNHLRTTEERKHHTQTSPQEDAGSTPTPADAG